MPKQAFSSDTPVDFPFMWSIFILYMEKNIEFYYNNPVLINWTLLPARLTFTVGFILHILDIEALLW